MKKILITVFIIAITASVLPCFSAETGAEKFALDATEKGWNYFNSGDLETALKRFHQATILDPKFAPGYYGKAYVYSFQNKLDLAIENYRKTIELADPPYTHAYGNLGLALMMSGKEQEGFQMVQKALEIDPNNGEAHISLTNYYCSEKNGKLARVHLEKAIAIGVQPDPRLVEEMKKECP
jgi:Tfp pilus assembly protein PilF